MKFIDETVICIAAGNGGNGCISFNNSKYKLRGKPNGGNGGNGGSIWLIADKNLNSLNFHNSKKKFFSECGENGKKYDCTGKNGKDTVIKVPIGTKVYDYANKELLGDMIKHNQSLIVARGGSRGLGNTCFKSSINRTPRIKTYGTKGQIRKIKLKFILPADVGLIGLPNSGRSTFMNTISLTKYKIADYPFTTLSPNLSTISINNIHKFTIVDVPSIVMGSYQGYGLGVNFLKHLYRCQILLHFIDLSTLSYSKIVENIIIINNELKSYNKELFDKPRWLVFNKIDILNINKIKINIRYILNKLNYNINYYLISAINKKSMILLYQDIIKFLFKKNSFREFTTKI